MNTMCLKCRKEMVFKAADVKLIVHCCEKPWEIWSANRYQCPICGIEVLTEFEESCIDVLHGDKRFEMACQNAFKKEHYNIYLNKTKQ